MFERFTQRARNSIVVAQEQARLLNHHYIGTEHLLLGVIDDEGCVAAGALATLEVPREEVRRRVLEIVGEGTEPPPAHIGFTPRAERVLEVSMRQVASLHHDSLNTGHLLLGLLDEGEGVAAQVLKGFDLWVGELRLVVAQEMERERAGDTRVDRADAPSEEDLVGHARELAGLYVLPPSDVEAARRLLELDPGSAKARLALFVRFAKAFDLDPVDLARHLRAEARRTRPDDEPIP